MDPGLSHAVRTVFVRLFDEGMIYRGNRIINWCPKCTSAISDIEVNHERLEGEIVTLRYPLSGRRRLDPVATTRVETMLGDTGVAVNPDDERYKRPDRQDGDPPARRTARSRSSRDDAVDPTFGTGAVKVTPAHDANDFEIARAAGSPAVNIFDKTATVNENGGRFEGLDRYEARKAGARGARRPRASSRRRSGHTSMPSGTATACGTRDRAVAVRAVVRRDEAAREAGDRGRPGRQGPLHPGAAVRARLPRLDGEHPRLVHLAPALARSPHPGVVLPGRAHHRRPGRCRPRARRAARRRSTRTRTRSTRGSRPALWPFSTLGWPDDTEDLRYWYPTTVLSTAREIIYLWVARMIFLGLHFVGDVPFRDVVHPPVVRDERRTRRCRGRSAT